MESSSLFRSVMHSHGRPAPSPPNISNEAQVGERQTLLPRPSRFGMGPIGELSESDGDGTINWPPPLPSPSPLPPPSSPCEPRALLPPRIGMDPIEELSEDDSTSYSPSPSPSPSSLLSPPSSPHLRSGRLLRRTTYRLGSTRVSIPPRSPATPSLLLILRHKRTRVLVTVLHGTYTVRSCALKTWCRRLLIRNIKDVLRAARATFPSLPADDSKIYIQLTLATMRVRVTPEAWSEAFRRWGADVMEVQICTQSKWERLVGPPALFQGRSETQERMGLERRYGDAR